MPFRREHFGGDDGHEGDPHGDAHPGKNGAHRRGDMTCLKICQRVAPNICAARILLTCASATPCDGTRGDRKTVP